MIRYFQKRTSSVTLTYEQLATYREKHAVARAALGNPRHPWHRRFTWLSQQIVNLIQSQTGKHIQETNLRNADHLYRAMLLRDRCQAKALQAAGCLLVISGGQ